MSRNQYLGQIVGGLLDEIEILEERLKNAIKIIEDKDRQIAEYKPPEKYLDE